MTSHDLARHLLSLPDRPVAISALGHTYHSDDDSRSHGELQVVDVESAQRFDRRRYVVIGNMLKWAGGACAHWAMENHA